MFALFCCDFDVNKTSIICVIFKNIQNYNNVFNLKNAFIFSKYKEKDYKIDLLSKKKSSYNSLYILFEQKLIILYNYFLKNLILDRICELIN